MPTRYASLDLAEGDFNAERGNPADRDLLFAYLGFASRRVEEFCHRRFDLRVETRRYDAPNGAALKLDDDLIALEELVNGDGQVIDLTRVLLRPYNAYPKRQIALTSGEAWRWSGAPFAAIQAAGVWGFHRSPARAWQDAGVSVPDGGLGESDTTLVLADSPLQRGHLLKIDDEQVSIEAIDGDTLTLARGLNGSQPAQHETGVPIFVYRPEATIQRATARVAVWMYRQRDAPFEKVVTPVGAVVIPPGLPTDVQHALVDGKFVRRAAGAIYAV